MASPLVVAIPPLSGEGEIEITMYSPQGSPVEPPIYSNENIWSYCISIRSIFAFIFFLTAVSCTSLIIINYQGQLEIVERDTQYKIKQLNSIIIHNFNDIFSWTYANLASHGNMFYYKTTPPIGTNIVSSYISIAEFLFSAAQSQKGGTLLEYDFLDGRLFGIAADHNKYTLYAADFRNDSNLYLDLWSADPSRPINNINTSLDLSLGTTFFPPPYPIYPWMRNESREYLTTCDSPIHFDGLFGTLSLNGVSNDQDDDGLITYIGAVRRMCNQFNEALGYLYFGASIESYDSLLKTLANQTHGKFLVIDTEYQLVATSSSSPKFKIVGASIFDVERINVMTTTERWIKDVVKSLQGDLSNHNEIIKINNTKYYLSVENWSEYENTHWVIILLLDYNFLLASTPKTVKRSITISVIISVISAVAAFVASYYTTKLLVKLASNMKKIAALDLDAAEKLEPPRLIEIKRLYQSYMGMDAALRSFKKFVPTQIVSKIIRSKKEVVAELKFRHVTVMFQDIAGFTTLSESMNPANLAKLTSEYMGVMTTIICKNGGTIDKYVGDCIMSLFNAPEEIEGHPTAAAASAVECVQTLMDKNKEWTQKYGVEMHFRTGIHTGEVLIGNMGSDNRMNYTAFGDNVNIAARLEGVNKLFGSQILVSKSVHKTFPQGKFLTRKLGKIRVSGKSVATTVFEVVGDTNPLKEKLIKHYETALLAAKENRLDEALEYLEGALQCDAFDKASIHLQHRIIAGKENSNWSYIEDLVKY